MGRQSRNWRLFAAVLALGLSLTLMSHSSSLAAQPKYGGHLKVVIGLNPPTLDPHFVRDMVTAGVIGQIYEGLVFATPEMKYVPSLATSWENTDPKTWIFKLRKGVKFHDGTPFNAEAVKFVFERLKDPKTASPRRGAVAWLDSVEVIDGYTVKFNLKYPYAPMISLISDKTLLIASPAAIKKWGKDFGQHPVGTGPFMFKEWLPGQSLTFVANENYWNGRPYLDTLTYQIVAEEGTRLTLLRSGDVDMVAKISPHHLKLVEADPNLKVIRTPLMYVPHFGFKVNVKPFDDVRVRKALNYAVDVDSIIKNLLMGVGKRVDHLYPPVVDYVNTSIQNYSYDPEKAKKLLAEAGYPNGFETTMWAPKGRYTMDYQMAQAVQAQLAKVGVKAELKTAEWGRYISAIKAKTGMGMFMLIWGPTSGDLDWAIWNYFYSKNGGSTNYTWYSNPKVDELLMAAQKEYDPKMRGKLYWEAQEIIMDEAPWIQLEQEVQLTAAKKNVMGTIILPNTKVYFNKVWLE